ncbi:MAG TPA: hypothetical protein VMA83_09545 [Solirubrobacteraceae bacterium]|nr:hypothetical protein [Solirubrobacteraceae bacterium]
MRAPTGRLVAVAAALALLAALPATAAARRPRIAMLRATPSALAFGGGSVRIRSRVTGAARCSLSVSPRVAPTKGSSCRTRAVTLPANRSTSPATYTITLAATGAHGRRARRSVRVTVGGAVQIAAGEASACVLEPGGRVYCWGENTYGQLGRGGHAEKGPEHEYASAHEVSGVRGATEIAAGAYFNCALLRDGHVDCWGGGALGELGEAMSEAAAGNAVEVHGISDAVAVSAGAYHACALLRNATVECWGENRAGELGDGLEGQTSQPTPVAVKGLTNVAEIATGTAGGEATCARLRDGHVECWGAGEQGQLGAGAKANSPVPVRVSHLTGAHQLAAGSEYACAVITKGRVDCWGNNERGELGDGVEGQGDLTTPVRADLSRGAVQVAGGYGFSACAVLAGGQLDCWGWNEYGQLGHPGAEKSATPEPVTGISRVAQVAVGESFACSMASSGAVDCWGEDQVGQLGNGHFLAAGAAHPQPVRVVGLP